MNDADESALVPAEGDAPGARERETSLSRRLLRRIPGGQFVQDRLEEIERRLLLELKHRMDRVERTQTVSVVAISMRSESRHGEPGPEALAPSDLLRHLLAISAEQSRAQAELNYYHAVLAAMVPDEARILAAVSDGSSYPLLHVLSASRLGVSWHPVLEGVSSVGRSAGVMCPELTHAYVQRLRGWGLVESGPEATSQGMKYEILETEQVVRHALEQIKRSGQRSQIARRVLQISELGKRMWAAIGPSQE